MENETMTKEEIQRFIDMEARKGSDELEIFRSLREVLGVKYEPKENKK